MSRSILKLLIALACLSQLSCDKQHHPPKAEKRARARLEAIVRDPAASGARVDVKSQWQVQGGSAVLTLRLHDAERPSGRTALILAHRTESGCRTEISVAVSQAQTLGKALRQARATSDLRLVVDGDSTWTGPTFVTQYENSQERGFWATEELVNTLLDASVVHASFSDGLPEVEFPVAGIGDAIAAAMDNCYAAARAMNSTAQDEAQ